jgi:hypothetical protein
LHHIFLSFFGRAAVDPHILRVRVNEANAWEKDRRPFAHLSHQLQRDLHDYYNLSKGVSDEALIRHRGRVTRKYPNLPQRAGRAFLAVPRPELSPLPINNGKISIYPLVKSEPDVDKLTDAFLEMVKQMTPEDRAAFATEGEKFLRDSKRDRKAA